MVVRGAILMFGLIIAVSTVQRWVAMPEVQPGADAKPAPVWLHLIPLVLASSMIVQFPAKDRGSPLLMISVGLILASLLLLWLFSAGHLG
jgi:hypothetical protein